MQTDDWSDDYWAGAAPHLRVDGRCRKCLEQRPGTPPVLFQARMRDDVVRLVLATGRQSRSRVDQAAGHVIDDNYPWRTAHGLGEVDGPSRTDFPLDSGRAGRAPNLRCHRCGWTPGIPRRVLWAKVRSALRDGEHVVYV